MYQRDTSNQMSDKLWKNYLGVKMETKQLPLPIEDATVDIPLTQGQTAIIDAVDVDLVTLKWCAVKTRCGNYYAGRSTGHRLSRRIQFMHRVILERALGRELSSDEEVDHIDLDRLNNRRSNLRAVTTAQNQHNTRRRKDNTSGYKGVCRAGEQWIATINANGKHYHLGAFDTPEDAYQAYCEAAKKYHGEFARLD